MIKYISTRGQSEKVSSSMAILKGIANDGGLYVPEVIPVFTKQLRQMLELNYQDLAYEIIRLFLTDYTEEELRDCINKAYDDKFDNELIAPLVTVGDKHFLELFHGKTLAFKDMALSILPHLVTTAAKKNGVTKKIAILTATSGDTGKAALEGFADIPNTVIVVFYPEDGVSDIQKLQMVTQKGDNVLVVGLNGNFDDAQSGVKNIFANQKFQKTLDDSGIMLSSANSINIGRLVPQIVYYFYAYAQMFRANQIEVGEKINFTVPSGNFGNILAGFYAKQMGLPINKLICASNENKVLCDFLKTGAYNKNREFVKTSSPSMDILISSNLERFLYALIGDPHKIKALMEKLNNSGVFEYTQDYVHIFGEAANDEETRKAIKEMHKQKYTMDTHTAVAYEAYKKYKKETGDTTKNVIVSTASPFKFVQDVCDAINPDSGLETFTLIKSLSELSGTKIPSQIAGLETNPILHTLKCEKEEMASVVTNFLNSIWEGMGNDESI